MPEVEPAVRIEVRSLTAAEAHEALMREDPSAAARVRQSDTLRTARALEVVRSTGRPLSDWQRERTGGLGGQVELSPVILLPPRDWLRDRCDRRFAAMISAGGIAEVAALIERRLDPSLPVMRAIGVPEIAALITGGSTRQEALEAGQIATRQYAKRQYTWFRRQPPEEWPRLSAIPEGPGFEDALALLTG